jgi:hypothetical protein
MPAGERLLSGFPAIRARRLATRVADRANWKTKSTMVLEGIRIVIQVSSQRRMRESVNDAQHAGRGVVRLVRVDDIQVGRTQLG